MSSQYLRAAPEFELLLTSLQECLTPWGVTVADLKTCGAADILKRYDDSRFQAGQREVHEHLTPTSRAPSGVWEDDDEVPTRPIRGRRQP